MIGPEIITMELPHDRDWLAFPEFNILALAPHLDAQGRDRAIDEAYARWRESLQEPAPAAEPSTAA